MNKGSRAAPNGYSKASPMKRGERPFVTYERLVSILRYDPETGKWFALVNRRRTRAGTEQGSLLPSGYVQLGIDGKCYLSHALAWLYMTGKWADPEVDHRNLNRSDNRWINLREATHGQNITNRPAQANNKCGVKGVSWFSQTHKWRAAIVVNRKQIHLGLFATIELAAAAYQAASIQYHGEFGRTA